MQKSEIADPAHQLFLRYQYKLINTLIEARGNVLRATNMLRTLYADFPELTAKYADPEGWAAAQPPPTRPTTRRIVCLCGSTRFWTIFQEASLQETLAGRIVLSVGAATASDTTHFGHLDTPEQARIKAQLDALHLDKIALADEILVLNVDGYIGPSTRREIAYAVQQGKPVRWWLPAQALDLAALPRFEDIPAPTL